MFGTSKTSDDPRSGKAATVSQPTPSFAEELERLPTKQRETIDRLSPKQRAKVWADWLQRAEPDAGASAILTFHGGDARAAEADAWELYNLAAGGGWGEGRTNQDGLKYGVAVVDHILKGTEDPPVARVVKDRPRFM